jgi:hypothetical protein
MKFSVLYGALQLPKWQRTKLEVCTGRYFRILPGPARARNLPSNTVIPRYTSIQITSFRFIRDAQINKKKLLFNLRANFFKYELLPFANRSLFSSGSNGKLIFVLRVFALRAVLEELIKLVNRGITVRYSCPTKARLPFIPSRMKPDLYTICPDYRSIGTSLF